MPSISVIVPVYQAEKFLRDCVESVRRQTFSDWELLLVDDGCTDGSPALCDELAREDDRIRVFHKERNSGVSETRNVGLDHVRGTYIAFLDSDDQYEPQCLETLWNLRERAGADTAACAHLNLWPDGSETPEPVLPAGIYDADAIREKIVNPLLGDRLAQPVFNGFIWRYLFSAEIFDRLHLRYEGAYLEDELFLMEYFCNARRLAVTETPLYRYLQNPASAPHKYMKDFQQVFGRFMERKEDRVRMEKNKRPENTAMLSLSIQRHICPNNDPRIYWAREVTFDYATTNAVRVDFMKFKPVNNTVSGIEKGDFYCYEVKSSVEDFRSKNGHNFLGDYNYYVMPEEVYEQIKKEIPYQVGVYVPDGMNYRGEWYDLKAIKKAKRKDRSRPVSEMLLMMFRSAARDRKKVLSDGY